MNDNLPTPDRPDPMTPITEAVADLGVYLAMWSNRDTTTGATAAERIVREALAAIDSTLSRLHRLRSDLVTETRRSDDESAARTDEFLKRRAVIELPDKKWLDTGSRAGYDLPNSEDQS